MFFTIFFGYSGYLLWDSLAFGAATIGINMANSTPLIGGWIATAMFAGTSLSGQTVTRMYFLHVFILPVVVTTDSSSFIHRMGARNCGATLIGG